MADAALVPAKLSVPILVVDDNASKRLALKAVLVDLGYSIVEADSGEAALRCVMAQDFAVILLDVSMPIMDGFETAALIRARPRSEMTPIIFLTAYAPDEVVPASRYVEGAVDFIFAPVPPEELRAKVSVFANLFTRAEVLAARAREVQILADQLRLLTDAAPIGIFQTDTQNRYIYTNPRWTEITGIEPEEAAGRNWDTLIDAKQREALLAESSNAGAYPARLFHRFEIQPRDSVSRIVLVTSESIPDPEGGTAGWVGTLADVTAEAGAEAARQLADEERTALEGQLRQAQKMEAVGQLAGGIAHDFNNILAVVLNYAEFVAETLDEDHEGQADLKEIVKAGERGAALVHQLLAFSRQEVVQPSVIDVNEIVAGMKVLLTRSVGEEIELEIETSDGLSWTKVDPGQIEQILLNLVVNSRDSMPDGGRIKITTGTERLEAGARPGLTAGPYVCLTVTDTGGGIDPETLDHIFEPFFTTKARGKGTGLGLATVYGIVKQAGGGIYAESEVGTMTSFVVYLPVTDEEPSEPVGHPPADAVDEATILVVEDEDPVRMLIGRILRREGFDVIDVASGAQALEVCSASSSQIDLLLTDVVMPQMSGPALRDLVLPLRPDMGVLFMSGYTDELIAKRGVLDAGEALINKPFNSDQLLTSVRAALRSKGRGSVRTPATTARP